jgi:hypothetical protein
MLAPFELTNSEKQQYLVKQLNPVNLLAVIANYIKIEYIIESIIAITTSQP